MGKYRMYEPYGFDENQNYISKKSAIENDLTESKQNDEKELNDIEELTQTVSKLLTRVENVENASNVIVADDAQSVYDAASGSNIVLTSSDAISALTSNTQYSTVTIVGGNVSTDIKVNASNKLSIDGLSVDGDKGESNRRVEISANTVSIKNVTIENGSKAYNVFESSQNTNDENAFTKDYKVSNVVCDDTELNHNIFNIYTFSDGATVRISDSKFNLNVEASNIIRLSNYTNASGVSINFENVEWTYEDKGGNDWTCAGLIIYQPAGKDKALSGDTSAIETWTFNFKNCKYNGTTIAGANFGEHNQVAYGYNIGGGKVSDLSEITTFKFDNQDE